MSTHLDRIVEDCFKEVAGGERKSYQGDRNVQNISGSFRPGLGVSWERRGNLRSVAPKEKQRSYTNLEKEVLRNLQLPGKRSRKTWTESEWVLRIESTMRKSLRSGRKGKMSSKTTGVGVAAS